MPIKKSLNSYILYKPNKEVSDLNKQGIFLELGTPVRSVLLGGDKFEQRYIFKREVS